MPELSTVLSAGWPAGVGVGLALAGERLRTSRRRAALNRAMHELRRPLQALSLVTSRLDDRGRGAGTAVVTKESVDAALTALAELDREINRLPAEPSPRPVSAAALVHGAVERWRGAAAARGRALSVDCRLGGARVLADPRHLERALDNLIANSLEHGTLRVVLRATVGRRGVRIAVGDGGPAPIPRRRRRDLRRGQGLRIVGRIAREHGGRFLLDRSPAGTEAVLELPTIAEAAPPGLRAGAREPAA